MQLEVSHHFSWHFWKRGERNAGFNARKGRISDSISYYLPARVIVLSATVCRRSVMHQTIATTPKLTRHDHGPDIDIS